MSPLGRSQVLTPPCPGTIMRLRFGLLIMASALACSGKGTSDAITPPVVPTDTTPTGPVQRTSYSVRVSIDPADAALAGTAGVSVSGLTVRLTKAGSTNPPSNATTNANGEVTFSNLLDGLYTASVERTLTADEVARLPATERDASVFAGGVTTPVSPPNAPTANLTLVAARRGSLVISEFFSYFGYPIPYNWGSYVEIYNNSDTTAYLDGMYLAFTSWGLQHTDSYAACEDALYRQVRQDTSRLWLTGGIRFPGSGRDFPVFPGTALVYAPDALDHRAASGRDDFPDLSRATFEHVGLSSDTDNPLASNVSGAFYPTTGTNGRGVRIVGKNSWALLRRDAEGMIEKLTLPPIKPTPPGGVPRTDVDFFGVPKEYVLDVFSVDMTPSYRAYLASTSFSFIQCTPWLPGTFEFAPAELYDETYRPGAIRRRSLGRTAEGRDIVMRTRTSARDLEVTTNLLQRSLNK